MKIASIQSFAACSLLFFAGIATLQAAGADGQPLSAEDILRHDPRVVVGKPYDSTAQVAYYARVDDGTGQGSKEVDLGLTPVASVVTISGKRFTEIDFASNGECGSGGCYAESLFYLDQPTFAVIRGRDIDRPDRVENGWLITQIGAPRHPNWDYREHAMAEMRADVRWQDVAFGYYDRQFMRRWNWKTAAIQPEAAGATVEVLSVEGNLVHARVGKCMSPALLDDIVSEDPPPEAAARKFAFVLDHVDSLKSGSWVRLIGGLRAKSDPTEHADNFPRNVRTATVREIANEQSGNCPGR
jgi:hypothetical protein